MSARQRSLHPLASGQGEIFGRQPMVFGSSAPSMHVFAQLNDVYPDGTTRPVTFSRAVVPGSPSEPVALEFNDIAYQFGAGHQPQLRLQSGNFPFFLVHPGTDENPWFTATRREAVQHVTVGGSDGARLTLPVIEG